MISSSQITNKNHHLHYEGTFSGLPVMAPHLPMITEMLETFYEVTSCAIGQYRRVFAFRVDLRLPGWVDATGDGFTNITISKFFESLKAKIRHNRARAAETADYAHDTRVRYFWVREVGDCGRVHYHCTILLNADAFFGLGSYQSPRENMATRVFEAWASALDAHVYQVRELVHFPENPSFLLKRTEPASVADFFHRTSYLCKAATKHSGYGHHSFGASRG